MAEEQKTPAHSPSETVKRLRESFAPAAARLRPEDEPAVVYTAATDDK